MLPIIMGCTIGVLVTVFLVILGVYLCKRNNQVLELEEPSKLKIEVGSGDSITNFECVDWEDIQEEFKTDQVCRKCLMGSVNLMTNCGHCFHVECLKSKRVVRSCPFCGKSMVG